jgi:hypothetical protein
VRLAQQLRPPPHAATATGLGNVTLKMTFSFLSETGRLPRFGVFPMVSLPTGAPRRGLGAGRPVMQLPVWAQKSWGSC